MQGVIRVLHSNSSDRKNLEMEISNKENLYEDLPALIQAKEEAEKAI